MEIDYAKLDALPERNNNYNKQWTTEMDKALLKYWGKRGTQRDVAEILGVCVDLCRHRYKKLTQQSDKK